MSKTTASGSEGGIGADHPNSAPPEPLASPAMPFHIEVAPASTTRASFNLTAEELRRTVLEPWISGRPVLLGDRKWEPEESELRILEGPELSNPELSFGQGWANAERASEDVTAEIARGRRESAARAARPGGAGHQDRIAGADRGRARLGPEARSVVAREPGASGSTAATRRSRP